ncbi:MAG: spore coat protein U domain-containing protein [Burkholderiaceae bacterium]
MTSRFIQGVLGAALALGAKIAGAAVACSVSVAGFSSVYDSLVTTANDNVSSYSISCTRSSSDPATIGFSLAADNGLYFSSPTNRASRLRGNINNRFVDYDVYRSNSYAASNKWGSGGAAIGGTLAFGSATSATSSGAYYARIPAQQNVSANRNYVDTVSVTLTYGPANASAATTFPVSISTSAQVQIAVPPGEVVFNYNSFAPAAQLASTSYVVRGTSGIAYTMALDSSSGSVLGLNYSLSLSATGGTANGALQSYTINGSMAAGQSGTCSAARCSASQARTLTITY